MSPTTKPKTRDEWKALLVKRNDLEARARHEFAGAQERYEAAAAKKLPTRAALAIGANQAMGTLYHRHTLTRQAKAGLAKAPKPAAGWQLEPERTVLSPNFSSRNGARPRLIVVHITVSHNRPGLEDIDGILALFGRQATQASSHIVNDRDGHDARCVRDQDKAWTQAAFNPVALSIEQIEFSATRTRQEWLSDSRKQLDNTASWVAKWSIDYKIPLTHSTSTGVCQHMELGAAGGGHSDCGPGYPLDYVLQKASEYARARRNG